MCAFCSPIIHTNTHAHACRLCFFFSFFTRFPFTYSSYKKYENNHHHNTMTEC